ncbi:MAG: HAMP domain-containing protein [bacterium]
MMMKKGNKKRKTINFSIKKGMQFRLIFRIFIIILIAVMLSGVIFWVGSHKKVDSSYRQFHVQLRNFRDMILPLAIIGTIAGLLGALILSLFFPLHLVGPLYRIEKSLERVTNGDLSNHLLNIRSGDELHELACQVTRMTEKMKERIKLLKEQNKREEIVYNQMRDAFENSDMKIIKETISGLDQEIERTREILDEFKI